MCLDNTFFFIQTCFFEKYFYDLYFNFIRKKLTSPKSHPNILTLLFKVKLFFKHVAKRNIISDKSRLSKVFIENYFFSPNQAHCVLIFCLKSQTIVWAKLNSGIL